jgi:hypothetical protein
MAAMSNAGTIEADNAAADAAREARDEIIKKAPKPVGATEKAKRTSTKLEPWDAFQVDVWLTNLNSIEFGFWKKDRNKAKSRQFTSDMDIFAEVTENGERTGLLGYREELWTKASGMDKRLVFKLFGEKLNWHATMDLMLGRSLQLTLGAHGVPVMAFSINTNDHTQMVYVERSAYKLPFMPEEFSFFLLEDGQLDFYTLRRDIFALGKDYTLRDQTGRVVGRLDGLILSLGGTWRGRVLRDHKDKRLLMVLKLFCGMLPFNNGCRRHIRSLYRAVYAGRLVPKLERQEADLYMNPRRTR